jgi:type I restriction enzyme S subunit
MKQGWEIKRLDDVCEVEYGTRVVNKRDGGRTYPVYGGGGATFFMDTFNRENCFIVSRFAMSEQCTRFVSGKFFLNDSGLSVRPKNSNEILQDFLNMKMLFLNDHIYSLARGTAQKNLDVPAFRNIQISYPKSLHEQQRIVAILDEAFATIAKAKANAEQNLKNAKELFENSAQKIFTQKGIDWEENLLGEFATFRNGINYTKGSKGEKIKIVGVKDFQDSYWVPDNNLVEVSLDGKINETDLLKEGDILAVRSNGNPELIGRTLLAGKINEKVSHSGFTIRIRLNSKIVNPNYLCHFLKIQQTRKTLVESGNGVGIRSLNQGSLSSLKIPFPKSLKKQEAIIDKVDSIADQSQRLKDIYQRKINDLEELKKSILQKAFAGELKTEKLQTV